MSKFLGYVFIFFTFFSLTSVPIGLTFSAIYLNNGYNENYKYLCPKFVFLHRANFTSYSIEENTIEICNVYDDKGNCNDSIYVTQYRAKMSYEKNKDNCYSYSEWFLNKLNLERITDEKLYEIKDLYRNKNENKCRTDVDRIRYNFRVGFYLLLASYIISSMQVTLFYACFKMYKSEHDEIKENLNPIIQDKFISVRI